MLAGANIFSVFLYRPDTLDYPVSIATLYFIFILKYLLFSLSFSMMTAIIAETRCVRASSRIVLRLRAIFVLLTSEYYHGACYPLLLFPIIAIVMLNLAGLILYRKRKPSSVF